MHVYSRPKPRTMEETAFFGHVVRQHNSICSLVWHPTCAHELLQPRSQWCTISPRHVFFFPRMPCSIVTPGIDTARSLPMVARLVCCVFRTGNNTKGGEQHLTSWVCCVTVCKQVMTKYYVFVL